MARSISKNSKYDTFPGDKSRKDLQRTVNRRLRSQTRQGLRLGIEALPVLRRQVDRMAH